MKYSCILLCILCFLFASEVQSNNVKFSNVLNEERPHIYTIVVLHENAKGVNVTIANTTTVMDLKRILRDQYGYDQLFDFFYKGIILSDDKRTLFSYGIREEFDTVMIMDKF